MTGLSLARLIKDELATLRQFDPGARPSGRPRQTTWSEKLPGFGVRHYGSGRSTYVVQALMNGTTRTITLGNTSVLTEAQALGVARRIMLRVQEGEDPATKRKEIRKTVSYAAFLDQYWKHASLKWKPLTVETHNGYRRKYLDRAFVGMFLDEIEHADVLAWFNAISVRTPGSANRCMSILSAMFAQAERWGLRPEGSNPCNGVRFNKRRRCERFLSEHEIGRLGDVLQQRMTSKPAESTIVALLLLTGCRLSEIVGLTWNEVKGNRLLLHDSKTGPRTVWLGDEAKALLDAIERRSGGSAVFWNTTTGRPVKSIGEFWSKVRTEAALPDVRLHDLRHTFASHAAARSETLPMIGKLLGHARLQTTSRYAHLDDAPVIQAAEQIGALLMEALGASS